MEGGLGRLIGGVVGSFEKNAYNPYHVPVAHRLFTAMGSSSDALDTGQSALHTPWDAAILCGCTVHVPWYWNV